MPTQVFRILFILFFLLNYLNSFGQLSGIYTIGGTSPDYIDVQTAVYDLETLGISGPVTFNIRSGNYEENIIIHNVDGASESNPIIFQSETGNKSDAVLHHFHINEHTSFNYTLYFSNAEFITFKNLTIRADHEYFDYSNGRRVIYITDQSSDITFDNCNIQSFKLNGVEPLSWSEHYYSAIYIGNDLSIDSSFFNKNITIKNSVVDGGYFAIFADGDNSEPPTIANNISLFNNDITGFDDTGIKIEYYSGVEVVKNRIDVEIPDIGLGEHGIYIREIQDSLRISGNFIHGHRACSAIRVSRYIMNGNEKAIISNNGISLTKDTLYHGSFGFRLNQLDTTIISNNSVWINPNTVGSGVVLTALNNSKIELSNNHLVNYDGGLCISLSGGSQLIKSDYNNYFNYDNTLSDINSIQALNVDEMNTLYETDTNSSVLNPLFMNHEFLIPLNHEVYNTGIYNSNVEFDFFESVRSFSTPDIGYYEGEFSTNDVALNYCNLNDSNLPNCMGDSIAVYTKIANYGSNILNSTNIHLQMGDSTLFDHFWTGTLDQGDLSDSILLGYLNFMPFDSISFKAYTDEPNFSTDEIKFNDTISFDLVVPMNGVYTVGNEPSNDFDSLKTAVEALAHYGVCGPVIFNINPGIYEEQITIPYINGASFFNTITFQSVTLDSTDVTIKFEPTSLREYVIELNQAQHIIFKHLTVQPYGTAYNIAFRIHNGSDNNRLTNLIIKDTNISANVFIEGNSIFQGIDNLTISNCQFNNSTIRFSGSDSFLGSHLLIENNRFHNLSTSSGIFIENCNNIIFRKNIIENNSSRFNLTIEHCTGDSILISKNWFKNVDGTVKLGGLIGTPYNSIRVCNNFFGFTERVISVTGCEYIDFYNNNFNNSRNDQSVIFFTYPKNIKFFNNILMHEMGGDMINIQPEVDTSLFHSDNNLYYSKPTDPFYPVESGEYFKVGDAHYNLLNWQNNFDFDLNSLQSNPLYISSEDLHIDNGAVVNGNGIPIETITDDFDNEPRNVTTPDIGADEYDLDSLNYLDIEILGIHTPYLDTCLYSDSIILKLVSHSIVDIDSFTVRWWLFDQLRDSTQYTINISPNDTVLLPLSGFDFNSNTYYDFYFQVINPNGDLDNYPDNNVMNLTYYHLENVKIYQNQVSECLNETELYIKEFPRESIHWFDDTNGNSTIVSIPGTYNVEVTDDKGCLLTGTITID